MDKIFKKFKKIKKKKQQKLVNRFFTLLGIGLLEQASFTYS